MTTGLAEWRLDLHRFGRVLVYDELDSTNTRAADLAGDPANDGLVLVARRQTAGRGQHGRTWQSPAGSSVLLSVLFFPPPELRRAAVLTAWAAVAVCDTVAHATGVTPAIKWPNDVLVGGRKICGILTEQARGTVVGVGLNVNQTDEDFRAAGLPEATSLKLISGRSFDCDGINRLLIGRLDDSYERLCHGDLRTLESAWEERIGLTGAAVNAECLDGDYRGRLLGLGFDGVVLELGGRRSHFSPEMIRHLRPL